MKTWQEHFPYTWRYHITKILDALSARNRNKADVHLNGIEQALASLGEYLNKHFPSEDFRFLGKQIEGCESSIDDLKLWASGHRNSGIKETRECVMKLKTDLNDLENAMMKHLPRKPKGV